MGWPTGNQPLVSVIMPTWNCEAYLGPAIDSVLAQTWPRVEIIVVNDGSTDDTAALLASYEGRIKTIHLSHSGGPSRPRNVGLAAATGEFIAFCDADDLMRRDKLDSAMAVFVGQPKADLVFTSFTVINDSGAVVKDDWLAEYRSFRRDLVRTPGERAGLLSGDLAYGHLLRINFIGTSGVVCRRKVLEAAGDFAECLPNSGDIDMWRRIAWHGFTFAFLDEIGHAYRKRAGSICARGGQRGPYMVLAYERQYAYCRNAGERRVVTDQIRQTRLGYAWYLRRCGRLEEAMREYRLSLQLGWSLHGALGFARTRMQAFLHQKAAASADLAPAPATTRVGRPGA